MGGTHLATDSLPSHEQMVENITSVYAFASHDEKREGILWYVEASEWAQSIASAYYISKEQAAQVVAALSPLTPWARNLELATDAIKQYAKGAGPELPTLSNSWKRARQILEGKSLKWQPKTDAFWHLIADPLSSEYVCIDSHALAIAFGLVEPGTFKVTTKTYGKVADAYRDAARRLGLLPSHIQAITWVTRHRLLVDAGYPQRY